MSSSGLSMEPWGFQTYHYYFKVYSWKTCYEQFDGLKNVLESEIVKRLEAIIRN